MLQPVSVRSHDEREKCSGNSIAQLARPLTERAAQSKSASPYVMNQDDSRLRGRLWGSPDVDEVHCDVQAEGYRVQVHIDRRRAEPQMFSRNGKPHHDNDGLHTKAGA